MNKIDPYMFNPRSRFGEGFYLSENPDTTLAELAHYNSIGTETIRFEFNNTSAKILDLTNPQIAKSWGYRGGDISSYTRSLGERIRTNGYNAIRYSSERSTGSNIVILSNFDELLMPQMIVPTPRRPGL